MAAALRLDRGPASRPRHVDTMSRIDIDNDWDHLWPDFRDRLRRVFADCRGERIRMVLFEGYRSPERQLHLFAQGRTRPGPKVTGMKFPKWHGAGLAADCYPVRDGRMVFAFSQKELRSYRHAMARHGLRPTSFAGDFGHCELACDEPRRKEAEGWANAGFPRREAVREPVAVLVAGAAVECFGYIQSGASCGWVRPLATALGIELGVPSGGRITLRRGGRSARVPCEVREGRAFIILKALEQLPGLTAGYDRDRNAVVITAV